MITPARTARTVEQWLEALAGFSAGGPGVTRLAWTDAWCDAQRWLAAEAAALGLEATVDAAGNLYMHDPAVRPGAPDRPVVLTGSHLDSVVHGGRYDGALGSIAGLLIAAACRGGAGLPDHASALRWNESGEQAHVRCTAGLGFLFLRSRPLPRDSADALLRSLPLLHVPPQPRCWLRHLVRDRTRSR